MGVSRTTYERLFRYLYDCIKRSSNNRYRLLIYVYIFKFITLRLNRFYKKGDTYYNIKYVLYIIMSEITPASINQSLIKYRHVNLTTNTKKRKIMTNVIQKPHMKQSAPLNLKE